MVLWAFGRSVPCINRLRGCSRAICSADEPPADTDVDDQAPRELVVDLAATCLASLEQYTVEVHQGLLQAPLAADLCARGTPGHVDRVPPAGVLPLHQKTLVGKVTVLQ